MLFKDVIGQAEVKQQLVEMVAQNRLSHALLLLGPEGSGALSLGIAFANYLSLIPGPSKGQQPANPLFADESLPSTDQLPHKTDEADAWMQKQPGYSKSAAMVHPDIHFSYPVIPKKSGDKPLSTDFISEWREFVQQYPYGNVYDWLQFIGAENKQGNITAHECNDINHKLYLKSFESSYKILLMWMPEYLGNEGNKLLKLIEEPPPDTIFVFVAENESLILPTILSRIQLIRVPPLEIASIENMLIEKAKLQPEQARQIAAVCEGNYRDALQLLQHAEEDWQSLLRDWLNAALKTGPAAQVKWVEEISKLGREKQKQFLRYFNHLLEQAIRLNVMKELHLNMAENERDFAIRLNKIADVSQQQAIIEELDKAVYYIERNANAKMLFHALTIKLYHIIANKEVLSET
ncbi:MAG: ATP-binding protein [Chitinophagales bacterium]